MIMPRGWQDQRNDPWSMFGLQGGGFGALGVLSRLGGRPGAMPAGSGALPPVAQIQGAISPYSLPQTSRPEFMSPMAPLAAQRGETQRLAQPAGFGLPDLSRNAPAGPLAPVANAPNTPKQGGVMGALNRFGAQLNQRTGFEGQDWLRLGLGLMAAGEEGGGGWGAAAETFGAVQDGARGRRFENEQMDAWREETARQRAMFERTTQREDRTDQEREVWIAGLPEEDRALARLFPEEYMARNRPADPMITADGIAIDPRTGKQLYQVPDIVTEDEQLQRDLVRAQIGRAQQEKADPLNTARGRLALTRLDKELGAVPEAEATIASTQRMREIVTRLSEIGGMATPLDASSRITMSRLLSTSKEAKALLEEFNSLGGDLVLKKAEAIKPVSNVDMTSLKDMVANANWEVASAARMLDRMENQLKTDIERSYAKADWFDRYGGLAGTQDEQGRSFEEAFYNGRQSGAAGAPGAPAPAAALPAPVPTPAVLGRGGASGPVGGSGGRGRAPANSAPVRVQPPPEAIRRLRQDASDPAAVAEFDERFGRGAAQRYLAKSPRGTWANN